MPQSGCDCSDVAVEVGRLVRAALCFLSTESRRAGYLTGRAGSQAGLCARSGTVASPGGPTAALVLVQWDACAS